MEEGTVKSHLLLSPSVNYAKPGYIPVPINTTPYTRLFWNFAFQWLASLGYIWQPNAPKGAKGFAPKILTVNLTANF